MVQRSSNSCWWHEVIDACTQCHLVPGSRRRWNRSGQGRNLGNGFSLFLSSCSNAFHVVVADFSFVCLTEFSWKWSKFPMRAPSKPDPWSSVTIYVFTHQGGCSVILVNTLPARYPFSNESFESEKQQNARKYFRRTTTFFFFNFRIKKQTS